MFKRLILTISILGMTIYLESESLIIVNRTGDDIEMVQVAESGSQEWSRDYIPSDFLLDGQSSMIDLVGDSPWSLRLTSTDGKSYVVYDVAPKRNGKVLIKPENFVTLSRIAGLKRSIKLSNVTDYLVLSMQTSEENQMNWGENLLGGRTLRKNQTVDIDFTASAGNLTFDIRYLLLKGNREFIYKEKGVILTDGASLVLQLR